MSKIDKSFCRRIILYPTFTKLTEILVNKKTLLEWMNLAAIDWEQDSSTQQVKYVGNIDAFWFGFFMSPKWTKTKNVIGITPLLQAYSCLPLVQAGYGVWRISLEVLIEISLVLIVHGIENPFQHLLICICII